MIAAALRRLARPKPVAAKPSVVPDLERPEDVRPPAYEAIVKSPAWPMDTTGTYRPDGEIPPAAVWVRGARPTVIMIRVGDVQNADLLPEARGQVMIGRRGQWQTVPAGWRFVTAEWVFRDLADLDGDNRPAGDLLASMTIEEFTRTVSGGKDRVGVDHVTPYEFGTDLRLDEYRAEQQQIAEGDKERPRGVSTVTLAILAGVLVAMLIFAPQPQAPKTPVGPETGVQTASVGATR